MTPREFLKQLEAAYGFAPYSAVMARMIGDFLASCGLDLDVLFRAVIERFSTRWGRLPGLADVRAVATDPEVAIYRKRYVDASGHLWSRGRRVGHYDENRLIPDLSVQTSPQPIGLAAVARSAEIKAVNETDFPARPVLERPVPATAGKSCRLACKQIAGEQRG
jgi:hypothetical protein